MDIGPDLGEGGYKWECGVLANTGSIYCAPCNAEHILKIDTIQGTVETLDNVDIYCTVHHVLYFIIFYKTYQYVAQATCEEEEQLARLVIDWRWLIDMDAIESSPIRVYHSTVVYQ